MVVGGHVLKFNIHIFMFFVVTLAFPATASDFEMVDGLWQFQTIKMKFMPHPDYDTTSMEEMLLDAAATWNNSNGGPIIEIETSDEAIGVPAFDGVNAIFVSDNWEWDPNYLALTFSHVHKGNKTILETDIGLNPGINWVFGDFEDEDGNQDPTAFDLQSAMAHEFGHVLGVPHIEDSGDATMFPEIQSYELLKRDINDEDESCMKALYEGRELTEPFDPNAASSGGGGCQSSPVSSYFAFLCMLVFLRNHKHKTK